MEQESKVTQCEVCEEMGCNDCERCYLGNPCVECKDYDEHTGNCVSDGGCGTGGQNKWQA